MGKKKKGGKKAKQDQQETFKPVIYVTNKVATMIEMLDSPEPKVLLRVIGTLSRAATENEQNLKYMLSYSIYGKLLVLLTSPDIYTLRFTLYLIEKIVGHNDYIWSVSICDLSTTADLVKIHFLKIKDILITTLTAKILLHLAKHNSVISDHIYSTEILEKIFELLTIEHNLELAQINLQLIFYLINSVKAEEQLLKCKGFSIASFLCFLELNFESLKDLALNILYKMAMWNRTDVLLALGNAKVIEAVTRLLFSDPLKYYDIALQVMHACLMEDACAAGFVKSLEFVRFLEWVRSCPKTIAGPASSILKVLSEKRGLLQVLFDFSMEESATSLLRFGDETVILNICEVIQNMMVHKYCCEKMATPLLMHTLVEIAHDETTFGMIPYGEKALETLHKFFQCYVNTSQLVKQGDTIYKLIDIFCIAKNDMNREGYLIIIEIMQYLANSEYCHSLWDIELYQTIIALYKESTFEQDQLLNIMESFLDDGEFRDLFLEKDMVEIMMQKIRSRVNSELMEHILMVFKKLIVYKKIGMAFINNGYLAELNHLNENIKFETNIIEQIINALYDFCLTAKFYHKNKLYENDKIRNDFILIPDSITSMPLHAFNLESVSLSTHVPILMVKLGDLGCEDKEEAKSESSNSNVTFSNRRLAQRKSELAPFHFLASPSVLDRSSSTLLNNTYSKLEDPMDCFLPRLIKDIYEEIHTRNPMAYIKQEWRVRHIAKCIDRQLAENRTTNQILERNMGKQHTFEYYITEVIKELGTNFVPVGCLKHGCQRERALLFKVICDQTKVSVTLCKEGRSYFNEVSLICGDFSDNEYVVQRVFIVDLMDNIGDLIPADSPEATLYLDHHKTEY